MSRDVAGVGEGSPRVPGQAALPREPEALPYTPVIDRR